MFVLYAGHLKYLLDLYIVTYNNIIKFKILFNWLFLVKLNYQQFSVSKYLKFDFTSYLATYKLK